MKYFSTLNPFQKARIILSLWYIGVLLSILVFFSISLYTSQSRNFTRIVLERDFSSHIPRKLTISEILDIKEQIEELRISFIKNMVLLDTIIIVIGGGLSYFLAGKTLFPIKNVLEKQKEFIADASHELRTPISALRTASEVTLRKKNALKEDYKNILVQILDESKRMGNIVEDLLTLSRFDIENSLTKKECRLDEIVKEVIGELNPLIINKKLNLKNVTYGKTTILADKNKVKQLVLILLDNAIKYTKEEGTIFIKVKSKPKSTLSILDTGIGISEKDKNLIFERFYQVDKSRSDKGSGLGLSIAKKIADSHKAKITLESNLNKGSKFEVIFS